MSVHFSVRDILFTPSTKGVRIICTTDIPCHLYCRLSLKKPWIHKTPSLRRGIQFAEDVRFCFTVYEDNEQTEPGDTNIHTWWKSDWPVCTTKWFYFWGTIGAEVSVSTTPFFKYHNDGVSPVPTPEPMYQLNTIDPQFYNLSGGISWNTADVSRDIPEDATGAILQLRNRDTGQGRALALRKPGANYDHARTMQRGGTIWAIVGLSPTRQFEYRFGRAGYLEAYIMGYTGRDVVFPDNPINIKPYLDDVYHDVNIHAQWPGALIILTDMGSEGAWNNYHSIRPGGSSKEIYQGSFRMFPFCGVPESGWIQTKLLQRGHATTGWYAYAYIKQDATISLNGINYVGFIHGAWKDIRVNYLHADTRWAFLEYYHPAASAHVSARKLHSYFEYQGSNNNHGWMLTHVHHLGHAEVYSSAGNDTDELLQLAETH